jgi:hypothetical protein
MSQKTPSAEPRTTAQDGAEISKERSTYAQPATSGGPIIAKSKSVRKLN